MIALNEKYLTEIRNICKGVFTNHSVQIVLYGSRARGNNRNASDVDLAVISDTPLHKEIRAFRERIFDSTIPFLFDIVEFSELSDVFKKTIKCEGEVLWRS